MEAFAFLPAVFLNLLRNSKESLAVKNTFKLLAQGKEKA